jgi:hypothetical protein
MGRWEPDAESRFRAAALELFGEIGYEQTTVAAIAERAGLTARISSQWSMRWPRRQPRLQR